jgi:predicted ABC-type ATPase
MARTRRKPRCVVIAGPNGAGKTTFARDYLPGIAKLIHFVNADLIAGGISPLRPELAAIAAGRMVLRELSRLVEARAEYAFESTLSGLPRCPSNRCDKTIQARVGQFPQCVSAPG